MVGAAASRQTSSLRYHRRGRLPGGLGSSIGSTTERPTAVLAASDYYARRPVAAAGLGHTISRKKLVESSHQVIRQRRRNRPSNIRWRAPYDFLLVLEGQLDLRAV